MTTDDRRGTRPTTFFTFKFSMMRNTNKTSWQLLFKVFSILALLLPADSGFSNIPTAQIACPEPEVHIISKSGSSITFGCTGTNGAISYSSWHHRHENGSNSSVFNTNATTITFSGLAQGTYDFYFVTHCSGETSEIIIVVDILM